MTDPKPTIFDQASEWLASVGSSIPAAWAEFQNWTSAEQLGTLIGLVGLPPLLAWYFGAFRRRKPIGLAEVRQQSSTTDPTRPITEHEVYRRVIDGSLTRTDAEWVLSQLPERSPSPVQSPSTAGPLTAGNAAFVSAALDVSSEGDAMERSALVMLAEGKFEAASARYDADIGAAADPISMIDKLRRKARLFAPAETATAIDAYLRLLALVPEDLDALNELGSLHERVGDLAAAEAAYRRVMELAGADQSWISDAFYKLGGLATTRGDLDAAEDYLKRSLAIDDQLERKVAVARVLSALGGVALTRGDLNEAEGYLKRSLAIEEKLGSKAGVASDLGRLGLISLSRGALDAAEDYQKRSFALHEQLGDKEGMATELNNLGLIAKTRGDFVAAEGYFKRSLAINEQLGRKVGMAKALGNLGAVAGNSGDLDAAEDYFKRSLAIDEQLGHQEGVAAGFLDLGLLANMRGKRGEAVGLLKRALRIYQEMGAEGGEGALTVRQELAAWGVAID